MWSAHPYSLSAAPDHGRLRITVKDAGDHSAALAHLRPGTPVIAEGPFGHFTLGKSVSSRLLLIAGGSGIGPIRALAEELVPARAAPPPRCGARCTGPGTPATSPCATELDHLAREAGLRVVYLVGHRSELGSDPLSAAALQGLVPDVRSRDVYVCGPAGMTHNVLQGHAGAARAGAAAALRRLRDGMTAAGLERTPNAAQSALRRTRARRIVAFAGMLTTVAGLVGVRAAMTPAPTQALGSSGLVAEAGTNGTRRQCVPRPSTAAAGGGRHGTNASSSGKAYDVSYGVGPGQGDVHGDPDHRHHAAVAPRGWSLRRHQPVRRSSAAPRGAQRPERSHRQRVRVRRTPRPATPSSLQSALDQAGR